VKILVETTGEFMLTDISTGQTIYNHRPGVIEQSVFFDARIALGQISKLADLTADATDEEFDKFWVDSDGKSELAVDSFLSKFGIAPAPAKKGK